MNDAVLKHVKTECHKVALSCAKSADVMQDQRETLNDKEVRAITKRFRDLYYLAKSDHALSSLCDMLELEVLNGAYDDCSDVLQAKNAKYTGDKFLTQALMSIANTTRVLYVAPKLQQSTFLGLIADEGSAQGKSQLLSFYRACCGGKPVMVFAGIDRLPDGQAKSKYLALRHRMLKDKIKPSKLICFGSDGDSTFSGRIKGVVALFMRLIALLLAIHCVLHRVPLGTERSTFAVDYLKLQFFNIVEHLGRYYRDSPKRVSILEGFQQSILRKIIKITCSAFTRWLTHDSVTASVHRSLEPCLTELRQSSTSDVTSFGLYTLTCKYEFIAFLLISRDVLPHVAHLSRGWQAASTDFGQVKTQLDSVTDTLEHMIEFPTASREYQTLRRTVAHLESKDFVIARTPGRNNEWVEKSRRIWLRAVVDNLRARLPHPELLVAFHSLFDPLQYPAGQLDVILSVIFDLFFLHVYL